jgi:hypothetical protein
MLFVMKLLLIPPIINKRGKRYAQTGNPMNRKRGIQCSHMGKKSVYMGNSKRGSCSYGETETGKLFIRGNVHGETDQTHGERII